MEKGALEGYIFQEWRTCLRVENNELYEYMWS